MESDYVQMAQLKGVPYWRIVFRHILPNALLPTINLVALTIAWLLGGTVVIEVVFNYPGLGRLMIQAIYFRDLVTVQAIALILATLYVGLNLFADLLTLVANPSLTMTFYHNFLRSSPRPCGDHGRTTRQSMSRALSWPHRVLAAASSAMGPTRRR